MIDHPPLPIQAVMDEVIKALETSTRLVLIAPPGAGKTTLTPLVLKDAPWCANKKIIILEPRRLAARAAADRMASLLGERVGETVGLRMRFETLVSAQTRIEVMTEGVFVRLLQSDPELNGIGAVLFDEFHERSLDTDLGLALTLDAQSALCPDVRILVMSATMEGERIKALLTDDTLPNVPVIISEGRSFSVETRYIPRDSMLRIEDQVCAMIKTALHEDTGSILVFLPGQGEIKRVMNRLNDQLHDKSVQIYPLYGTLERHLQNEAIQPSALDKRKIVLATSIAETSLTIEGIRVVIDTGLARVPVYEPHIGITRLETVRVSKANADQRRGRAGRTQAGVCYRLWAQNAHGALPDYPEPEIKQADLTTLLLMCRAWGVCDLSHLRFLDAPPNAALTQAKRLLLTLGAIDETGALTDHGRKLLDFPLPPRLAHMLIKARLMGWEESAAHLALMIMERGLGGDSPDLDMRLTQFEHERSPRAKQAKEMANRWVSALRHDPLIHQTSEQPLTGIMLAWAFPQQIAMLRGDKAGVYQLANGRSATLDPATSLARSQFLCVADITGRAENARIMSAAVMDIDDIHRYLKDQIVTTDDVFFDQSAQALRARRIVSLGALILQEQPRSVEANDHASRALIEGLLTLGLSTLQGFKTLENHVQRYTFLRHHSPDLYPEMTLDILTQTLDTWLLPVMVGKIAINQLTSQELMDALTFHLGYETMQRLSQEAPPHIVAPTGSMLEIDYTDPDKPKIAVRVQELYGMRTHPVIGVNRTPLVIDLLSPARRPIQTTRDLVSFWKGSWHDVRKDMKGRYPKHVWPENPMDALPTTRAKSKMR
jgi:ATP-dependent helicase HrpB